MMITEAHRGRKRLDVRFRSRGELFALLRNDLHELSLRVLQLHKHAFQRFERIWVACSQEPLRHQFRPEIAFIIVLICQNMQRAVSKSHQRQQSTRGRFDVFGLFSRSSWHARHCCSCFCVKQDAAT